MIYRTQCAWCGCTISEEPCSDAMSELAINPETNVIVSHGICPDCRRRIEQNEFPLQRDDEDV